MTTRPKRRPAIAAAIVAAAAMAALAAACSDALLDEMTRIARAANEPTAVPATGSTITAHETISLAFGSAMDAPAVALSGDLAASYEPAWSADGKTLELNADGVASWAAGDGRALTVTVADGGSVVSYELSYDVFDGVCVSEDGSDGNDGSASSPMLGLEAAVARAAALYPGRASSVRVAEGTYALDSSGPAGPVDMVEGVSLYGGYDALWSARDPAAHVTTIEDTAAIDDLDLCGPIRFPEGVTNATVLDGFTIKGPPSRLSAAIVVEKAAPTISGNVIVSGIRTAGTLTGSTSYGIHVTGYDDDQHLAVVIRDNVVNANRAGGGAYYYRACGVYIADAIGFVIEGNDLSAGKSSDGTSSDGSCCIFIDNDVTLATTPVIARNRIDGGSSSYTYGILCYDASNADVTVRIENNLINAGLASMQDLSFSCSHAIETSRATLIVRNNTILVIDPDPAINWKGGGVYFSGSSCGPAIIENNIIISPSSTPADYFAIYTGDATYPIGSLKNNYFYGFTDGTTGQYSGTGESLAAMETRIDSAGGAAADNDETLFDSVNYDSGTLIMSNFMLDDDYRPRTTAPAAVLTGGLDGSALGWPFSDDYDGATRSGNGATGWSRGYAEKD